MLLALATAMPAQAQKVASPDTGHDTGRAEGSANFTSTSTGHANLNRLIMAPSIIWSGTSPGGYPLNALDIAEQLGGRSTIGPDGRLWANTIGINDNLDQGHSTTQIDGFYVQVTPNSGSRGSVNAVHGDVVTLAKPLDNTPHVGSFPAYVGGFFTARGTVNLGGTAATYGDSGGALWGINPNVLASAGATALYGIVGAEVDVTAQRGSSMASKFGVTIIQGPDSAVSGTQDDVALNVINTDGAIGWRTGIAFGNSGAYWPIDATGTLISGQAGQSGNGRARAANGVDFSGVSFTGAAFKSPGFQVTGGGAVIAPYLRATPTTVSGLPAADPSPTMGDRALVTDALACDFGKAVAGGGHIGCPVYYDGAWKAG